MSTPAELRNDLTALNRVAATDLAAMWRQVTTAAQARQALNDILPALLRTYGDAAATLAADWYDEARVKAGIGGRFSAIPVDISDPGGAALAGWAAEAAADITTMQALVAGGFQRRVANFARGTVMGSSVADRRARGWRRTGLGGCEFCQMLIGRGAVYTEASADFESHDNCRCGAEPAWN